MESNENYVEIDKLDKIINTAVHNLYTLGKENKTICFENFSFKDSSHLAMISIANIAHDVFGFSLKFKMSKFKLFFHKLKHRNIKLWKASKEKGIDINDFIFHIEKAYDEPGAFVLIHLYYYYEGKKKKLL